MTDAAASMNAARLAFDLARIYKASVTIVTVTAPRFVVGRIAIDDQREALAKITHLANLYRLKVEQVHREGNPIEEVLKLSPEYNLLVLAHGKERKASFFNPDVSQHLRGARRSRPSCCPADPWTSPKQSRSWQSHSALSSYRW